jgi:protein phosphatase
MLNTATASRLQFLYAWRQSQGRRARQEDYCMTSPAARSADAPAGGSRVLVALADGMGGHVSGQIASRTVCDSYVRAFSDDTGDIGPRLANALALCNDAVAQAIVADPTLAGMGSTLVAAHVDGNGVRWVSVGDSTLMLYRGGILQRLNADHSHGAILDQQAAAGIISEEVAKGDARRRALHSAITGQPIPLQDLGLQGYPLEPGDWVILASDGLLTLSGDEIATLIHDYADARPDELVAALVAAVEDCGEPNQDNTTVAALSVHAVPAAADDADAAEAQGTPDAASVTSVSTRIVDNGGNGGNGGNGRKVGAARAADSIDEPEARSLIKPLLISALLVGLIAALAWWWLAGG